MDGDTRLCRHSPEQLELIDKVFPFKRAADLARSVRVITGRTSLTYFRDKEDGTPPHIVIRHAANAGRPAVLHEFAHAYHLATWPHMAPDKGVPVEYCEAAAIVPIWRLYHMGKREGKVPIGDTGDYHDLGDWLRGLFYSLDWMDWIAVKIAAEAEADDPEGSMHTIMKRVLDDGRS